MPLSIQTLNEPLVGFSVEGFYHLQYRARHLRCVKVDNAKIIGLDNLKATLRMTYNKSEVLAYQAHFFIMLDRNVPDYILDIADSVIELENVDEIERCLSLCQLMVRTCKVSVPLSPVRNGTVYFSSLSENARKITIPEAVDYVLKKCRTIECSKCSRTIEHQFVDDTFTCECGKRLTVALTKRSVTTYHDDMKVRAYLLKTLAIRVADLTGIIINTKAERLVFPGDGVGVGALICHVLNRPYLSCDSSWVMERYRFPIINFNKENFKWAASRVKEGDVVILSHVVSMESNILDYNWGPCVVYEHETLYHGHERLKEVKPNFPYLRITDLSLWRSIPLKLSLDDRVIKHSVMTRYYEPGKIYFTEDSACIRLLNYYASLGNEVLVYPTKQVQEIVGLTNLTIRRGKEVIVMYKTRIGYSHDVIVTKFIDIKDDIIVSHFPYTASLKWYEGRVDLNTLVPKLSSMEVSGSRHIVISGQTDAEFVTFVPGTKITMSGKGSILKFNVVGGKEVINTLSDQIQEELNKDVTYMRCLGVLVRCNTQHPDRIRKELRRKKTN